jgi:cell division septation protein DedD
MSVLPSLRQITSTIALMFLRTGVMNGHDRSPVRRNEMNSTTESEKNASAPEVPQPKTRRTKKAKSAKKAARAKKPAGKPKADRANKKAEVIAMMKRAKGATLAEIMAVTKWQAHTVRGFVSILGSKGGEKIESVKNEAGARIYRIAK